MTANSKLSSFPVKYSGTHGASSIRDQFYLMDAKRRMVTKGRVNKKLLTFEKYCNVSRKTGDTEQKPIEKFA